MYDNIKSTSKHGGTPMRILQRCLFALCALTLLSSLLVAQTRSGKFGLGIGGNIDYLLGDSKSKAKLGGDGNVNIFYSLTEYVGFRGNVGIGKLRWQPIGQTRIVNTDYMYGAGFISIDMMPSNTFNPFILGGAGLAFYTPRLQSGALRTGNTFDIQYSVGGGFDFFLNEFWSLTAKCEYVMTGSKYYNGDDTKSKDSFLRTGLEVRYYFFDKNFVIRMLEALKERYK